MTWRPPMRTYFVLYPLTKIQAHMILPSMPTEREAIPMKLRHDRKYREFLTAEPGADPSLELACDDRRRATVLHHLYLGGPP